jgi:tetratricopeptide (TPR) repeat protein
VHQVLAQSFTDADRLDDAAKECSLAISLKPAEPGLHQELGDIYWKQNHLEQAESEFEQELKIVPGASTAIYKLAAIRIERSKPETAVALLRKVLDQHPDSREAHYQLARAESQMGKNDAAIEDFNLVVNGTGPGDPEIIRQSYYQLSQLYRRTQHPDQARMALNSFVKMKQDAEAQQDQKLQNKMKRAAADTAPADSHPTDSEPK